MSNVKYLELEALVPFDWLERVGGEACATFARVLLSPTIGLKIKYGDRGLIPHYRPRDHPNGRTAVYQVTITGQEALSWSMIESLKASLKLVAVDGKVISRIVDLEA